MTKRRNKKTLLQATEYSIFPAVMIMKEEDDGRKTLHPIPLEMKLLPKWLWLLLTVSVGRIGYAAVLFRILLEIGWLIEDVGATLRRSRRQVAFVMQRVTLELKMGTILTRQLTLGVLSG